MTNGDRLREKRERAWNAAAGYSFLLSIFILSLTWERFDVKGRIVMVVFCVAFVLFFAVRSFRYVVSGVFLVIVFIFSFIFSLSSLLAGDIKLDLDLVGALALLGAALLLPGVLFIRKGLPQMRIRFFSMQQVDLMTGPEFEQFCAEILRQNGFHGVRVLGGSGDQGVDIVASRGGKRYAVQCKCYSNKLGNAPVQEVFAGRAHYGCDVAAVMTNNYFTSGAVELARSTGVFLWDRDWIFSHIPSCRKSYYPKNKKKMAEERKPDADLAYDELLPTAIDIVVKTGTVSVSSLQQRLKIGYSRAAQLVDQMEEKGVVGPFEGSQHRKILISKEQWQEMAGLPLGGSSVEGDSVKPKPILSDAEVQEIVSQERIWRNQQSDGPDDD